LSSSVRIPCISPDQYECPKNYNILGLLSNAGSRLTRHSYLCSYW
jgi:hypothetical protein